MAAASTSAQNKARAPHVNLFDMPELMPGAQPGANPAQREEFEARCRKLHQDAEAEEKDRTELRQASAGAGATISDLEVMFPNLDPGLIRALRAEAPSAQHAIETLLALSAATGEPGGEDQPRPPTPPPVPVGVEDHDKFPTLVDSKGWQVLGSTKALEATEEEPTSVWRDRAKAAADKPAPKAQPSAAALTWGKKRETQAKKDEDRELPPPETDYEFRQRMGQKRAQNRLQYGRCRGKGAGKGATTGGAVRNGGGAGSDSESEESDYGEAA